MKNPYIEQYEEMVREVERGFPKGVSCRDSACPDWDRDHMPGLKATLLNSFIKQLEGQRDYVKSVLQCDGTREIISSIEEALSHLKSNYAQN